MVALSGGVDSAVLLALAVDALGAEGVLAVTGRSSSLAATDEADAADVARELGTPHRFVETRELDDPDYRANRGDRCFHCRNELFGRLERLARAEGFAAIAYGAIVDDLGDVRPGMRAADAFGVLAPLLEAGFSKADVRAVAASRGLRVRDKPAAACLSSRIPVGTEVTAERLARVESAERALRDLGYGQLRVRHHGALARIEFDREGLERTEDPAAREAAIAAVRAAGFDAVVVDPTGYRPAGGESGGPAPSALYSIEPKRDGGQ